MDTFTAFSITVTEEINSKKILTFIRTQIRLKNLLTTEKSCFYFKFLPQVLKYEVILFQTQEDLYGSGIFSFYTICEEKDQFTLFIASSFFTLYEYKTLLFAKNIADTSIEDIKSYIEQTYKIKVSKTVFIENAKLLKFSTNNKNLISKSLSKKLHKISPDNSFKVFSIYFIILCITFMVFCYYSYTVQTSNERKSSLYEKKFQSKELMSYKTHTKKQISNILTQFLEFIKEENIELQAIGYIANRFSIKLISTNKKALLDVLEYSQKRLTLQSIKFDSNLEQYIMEINLHD